MNTILKGVCMKKSELQKELSKVLKILGNDYNRFMDLFSDKPKGTLTKLTQTLRRIEMLLKMNKLKEVAHPTNKAIQTSSYGKSGFMVKVRPCGEKYKNKTYLGFMIGDAAMGSSISIKAKKIQLEWASYNPAMFVPELGEVIYGCGSWWSQIESEADLKDITDNDINNVWYVKALNYMAKKEKEEKEKG